MRCEDCCTAATIDRIHDEQDISEWIEYPLLSHKGLVNRNFDVMKIWQENVLDLDCSHFRSDEASLGDWRPTLAYFQHELVI